jgi:carboxyl-terminal processing protease
MIKSYNSRPLLLVVFGAALALLSSLAGAASEKESPYRNLEIFARVLAHIEASYVEPVDQDQLIYGAVRGMLKVLDPHSGFMTPSEFRVFNADEAGQYAGIGVEIDVKDGWLTVIAVYPGGPGERYGIRPGDRFLTINGRSARDLAVDDAITAIRGEPGTKVNVAIRRRGQEATVRLSLIRAVVNIETVQIKMLPKCIPLLKIRAFNSETAQQVHDGLDRVQETAKQCGGIHGLILDLRDNPGGLLESAVLVSDEFLDKGVVVSTYGRGKTKLRDFEAVTSGTRPPWRLVAIVNEYSASAAEIVAGALRDRHRAMVVGTRTFGKGTVQNIIALPDGSAIKLTTARYYTPSGRSIQAEGIEPDLVVEQNEETTAGKKKEDDIPNRENSLEGHLPSEEAKAQMPTRGEPPKPHLQLNVSDRPTPEQFRNDNQGGAAYQLLESLIDKK